MDEDIPHFCTERPPSGAYSAINLILLLLTLASNGFKVYQIIQRQTTVGISYLHIFIGLLANIILVGLASIANILILPGVYCAPHAGSLGFGALSSLFLYLASLVMLVYYLLAFIISSYYSSITPPTNGRISSSSGSRVLGAISTENPRTTIPYLIIATIFLVGVLVPGLFLVMVDKYLIFYLKSILPHILAILPFLVLTFSIPQICLVFRQRQTPEPTLLHLLPVAADSILFILVGISYRQFIAFAAPNLLDLIRGWGGLLVMLAVWLWSGYVIVGLGQVVLLGIYAYSLGYTSWNRQISNDGEAETEADAHVASEGETEPLLADTGEAQSSNV